jgi:hypothetical protein
MSHSHPQSPVRQPPEIPPREQRPGRHPVLTAIVVACSLALVAGLAFYVTHHGRAAAPGAAAAGPATQLTVTPARSAAGQAAGQATGPTATPARSAAGPATGPTATPTRSARGPATEPTVTPTRSAAGPAPVTGSPRATGTGGAAKLAVVPGTVTTYSGSGTETTPQFTTTANWQIAYSFNCSQFGEPAQAEIVEDPGSGPILLNLMTLTTQGSVQVSGSAGPHDLEVNSPCSWTVKVID